MNLRKTKLHLSLASLYSNYQGAKQHTGTVVCAIAASSMLLSAPVLAQQTTDTAAPAAKPGALSDQIQSINITATKRKEDASKVPLSVSVIGGDELTAQHITDFADATRSIPNISFSGGGGGGFAGNGPGLSNVAIRGVSSDAGSATVGIYLDDVSMTSGNLYSQGSAEPKFFDLDHIEVLRGPQGTLYGASSMGGTIKFISNQPNTKVNSTDIYTEVSSTSGGGTNYLGNVVLNKVLKADELAVRVGIQTAHNGGFINLVDPNTTATTATGINTEDDAVVRMALKWNVTKDLTLTPSIFYQRVKTGDIDVAYTQTLNGVALPTNTTSKTVREPGKDVLTVPSLTLNYDTGFGDLTSVTSYFKRNFDRTQDGTTVNSSYLGSQQIGSQLITSTIPSIAGKPLSATNPSLLSVVGSLSSAVYLNNGVTQFSQEVRLLSKPYDPAVSPYTWLVGAYASNQHTTVIDNEPVFGINDAFKNAGVSITDPNVLIGAVSTGFPNDNSYHAIRSYHDTQQAVFGEGSYYFSPTLHATAGVRYIRAEETYRRNAFGYFNNDGTNDGVSNTLQTSSGSKVTPKFALTWEVDKNNTMYASATEGFRAGGSNFAVPIDYCALTKANPLSYGPDSLWSYEIGNKSRFLNNTLSVNADLFYINWKNLQQQITQTCGFNYNTNVGNAKSTGGEIEVKFKPIKSVMLGLAAGYTDATLTDSDGAEAGVKGAVKGARVPGVPKYNVALTAQYNFFINDDVYGFARAAGHWTGASNGTLNPTLSDFQRPSYSTYDASIGLTRDIWEVTLYVKNLTNNQMVIQRPVVQNVPEVYRITPRTIGMSLSAKF
ncbi:TonB-dependent receptor [Undibacterium sp. RuRC25W]|uniref:TonB-dependent receptor n=1 Tax=Undibacterium sp. RuRC25W TaxID=3413047 RepID=UPI003BF0C0D5